MNDTEELLKKREKTHGDATDVYTLAYRIQRLLRPKSEANLQEASQVELDQLCVKLARMVHNPGYDDNYKDIKGYATLIELREVEDRSYIFDPNQYLTPEKISWMEK